MRYLKEVVFGMLMLSAPAADAQTPSLVLQPATQRIEVDSTATVQVAINGVQAMHAFSVRVAYDPLMVRCKAVRDKGFLGSMTLFFPKIDSLAGEVGVDAAILGPGGANGSGSLLELVFEGVRSGTAPLHFTTADLRDTANKPISLLTQDGEIRVGDVNGIAFTTNRGGDVLQAVSYPNPFNSSTIIKFRTGDGLSVISIYSLLGVEVLHRELQTRRGETSTITWNGCDHSGRTVASGVYLFRVTSGGTSACTRIMLLK
jgi:hypothetical protein